MPPHSTLLLFTDGLIQRRGESLDDAMHRLRRHTADHTQDPLDALCDDIALLPLRPVPPRHPGSG
ncbi:MULTISPECIES: SpoIIE family protein phosphatase [unclassified Streptomyces]|uniref:SpoIIE family protein phosphatase n=1 Tax=unclassified Streptomyces TaxID=2593676 RepID=UPI0040430C45